ncbi:hypothetical protein D3C80_1609120 [compost metagenome]
MILLYYSAASIALGGEITSPRQKNLVEQLQGLKNYFKDFNLLKDKPLEYIQLLEKYYVLAVGFGINVKYDGIEHDYLSDGVAQKLIYAEENEFVDEAFEYVNNSILPVILSYMAYIIIGKK